MILGLAGHAGSGKDTVASIIKELVPNTILVSQAGPLKELGAIFGFTQEQLWGPSEKRNETVLQWNDRKLWDNTRKQNAKDITNWLDNCGFNQDDFNLFFRFIRHLEDHTVETGHGMSARTFLQQVGTEFGRAISPTIWNDIAIKKITKALSNGTANLGIITDVRFRSEVIGIKGTGMGKVVLIKDPAKSTLEGANAKHASEAELDSIPYYWFDKILHNDKICGLETLKDTVKLKICMNWDYIHSGIPMTSEQETLWRHMSPMSGSPDGESL